MKVIDKVKELYGNEVLFAACNADEAEVDRLEKAYQEAWDSGKGFTYQTLFSERVDDEAEAAICVGQLYNNLKEIVIKAWLRKYSRKDIVNLCDLLFKGPNHCYTRIRLLADVEMSVKDVAFKWGELHPSEKPIQFPDPDIG